jgi:hypothetical protein
MQDDKYSQERKPNTLLAIFIIFQLLFFSIIIYSLVNTPIDDRISGDESISQKPKIKISDISKQLSGIPEETIQIIETELLSTIKLSTKQINRENTTATIRDGSLKRINYSDKNLEYIHMIVDLKDIEQSYRVIQEYSNDDMNINLSANKTIRVMCLTDERDIIYPEQKCTDRFDGTEEAQVIAKYIKFTNYEYATATLENETDIKVTAFSSLNDQQLSNVSDKIKTVIENLGFHSDRYDISQTNESDITYELYK